MDSVCTLVYTVKMQMHTCLHFNKTLTLKVLKFNSEPTNHEWTIILSEMWTGWTWKPVCNSFRKKFTIFQLIPPQICQSVCSSVCLWPTSSAFPPPTDAVHPSMLRHQTSVTCSPNILIPSVTDSCIVTPSVCSVSVHWEGSPDHVDPQPPACNLKPTSVTVTPDPAFHHKSYGKANFPELCRRSYSSLIAP